MSTVPDRYAAAATQAAPWRLAGIKPLRLGGVLRVERAAAAVPAAAVLAVAWLLAWREGGSVDAADWLPYALLTALVCAAVLLSGAAVRPARAPIIAFGALVALAAWTAVTIAWSPLPSGARDDALLVVLYALTFLLAVVTVRRSKATALGVVVAGLGALALATQIELALTAHPSDLYAAGRLFFPIGYWNAQAALFLLGFWPAVALAVRPTVRLPLRALCCGTASVLAAAALMVQSKGGVVAFAVSAVVVLAVSPFRLRLLAVVAIALLPVAAAYLPLTEPFRLDVAGGSRARLDSAISAAGLVSLLIFIGVTYAGAAYAFLDGRPRLDGRRRRLLSRVAGAVAVCALAAGLAAWVATVHDPATWLNGKWQSFKHMPSHEEGSSHLVNLGSNRYDFWRVAVGEYTAHPLGGIGQHGFATAYLQEGRSSETPQRAHSLELDQASETGTVGLVLLLTGLLVPLAVIAKRARASFVHVGILGAGVYWLVHASGDWIWTFPAVGLPLFFLLGLGAGRGEGPALRGRPGIVTGLIVAAVAVLAFLPPWLADRYAQAAVSAAPADARDDLAWARRLDPLSPEPDLVQSGLATTTSGSIAALRRAALLEPRSVTGWYLLGLRELAAHHPGKARQALAVALRLDPRDPAIAQALERTRRAK